MILKASVITNYVSLALMSTFTLMAVANNQISVFYIVYLFWFDEILRTVSKFVFYIFKKQFIQNQLVFISNIKSKFFLLFVYFVFIVIFFGFIIDWKNQDLILINFEVLLFQSSMFNFTLITFIVRELFLFFKNEYETVSGNILLSKGIIVLHISIIIGMLIWGFLPKNFYENSNSNMLSAIVIVPFLLLKLFFEIKTSKN
ncbi:hypothetical protein [Lutibacter maritimus]|uniref:Uncharacterized protein n=1 Tax=Lutibacter maritimus TaxID=593133 RepID=A0A1I6PRM3_9FLAO|nr:hypothetical protein [Lutibacter maritimus]SFS42685.1 hypothetical protein SAMN04488006_1287 [Lutibacter maritimus]